MLYKLGKRYNMYGNGIQNLSSIGWRYQLQNGVARFHQIKHLNFKNKRWTLKRKFLSSLNPLRIWNTSVALDDLFIWSRYSYVFPAWHCAKSRAMFVGDNTKCDTICEAELSLTDDRGLDDEAKCLANVLGLTLI